MFAVVALALILGATSIRPEGTENLGQIAAPCYNGVIPLDHLHTEL